MTRFLFGSAMALCVYAIAPAAAAESADQLHAACAKLGYSAGQVQFDQCVKILKDTMIAVHQSHKGKMVDDACSAAGLSPGSAAFSSCTDRLNTSLDDDMRNLG